VIDSCHGPGLDHGSRVMRVTGHKDPLLAYAITISFDTIVYFVDVPFLWCRYPIENFRKWVA